MCTLLKLDYAKLGVSSLFFFQKLSKKNLWRLGSTPPPLGKGRVKKVACRRKLKTIEIVLFIVLECSVDVS